MRSALLLPCPACLRHIRVDSEDCPFCARHPPVSFRTRPAPHSPRRTTRAGVFSHTAAASLLAATACGNVVSLSDDDAGADATTRDSGRPDGRAGDAAMTDVVSFDGAEDATDAKQDVAMHVADGGRDVLSDGEGRLDAADDGPCDSGAEAVDANECRERNCHYGCDRWNCEIVCFTPPYGTAFIEDAGEP
jgi:hypothetical protein